MRTKLVPCLVASAALVLAACGDGYGSGSDASPSTTGEDATAAAGAEIASQALVKTSPTPLGEVLTTSDGMTLYGLTEDAGGVLTCAGACAETWPPLTVDGPELPAGLDPATFGVVSRPDGTFQLTAGGSPLYRHTGDAAPGDTNGQGSGGVWFAVDAAGQLVSGTGTGTGTDAGTDAPPTSTAQEPGAGDSDYGY